MQLVDNWTGVYVVDDQEQVLLELSFLEIGLPKDEMKIREFPPPSPVSPLTSFSLFPEFQLDSRNFIKKEAFHIAATLEKFSQCTCLPIRGAIRVVFFYCNGSSLLSSLF